MKKLFKLLLSSSIIVSSSSSIVSCYIGVTSTRDYISSFSDFDWSDSSKGDAYNYKFDDTVSDNINYKEKNIDNIKDGTVDTIWNYDNNSTGYQRPTYLQKQGTTGVPTNKSYMPTGNSLSDFGVTSKSQMYTNINSLENWDTENDKDIEYNSSSKKIRGRNYVADNQVSSQQKSVFFNTFRQHARSQGTYNNTIVGTKNSYTDSENNLQYIHEYIDWAGLTDEGFVTPPAADLTDACHENGTPIYGVIFLDGWQNLTKKMVDKMLEKNSDGHYKMVDIMINMCIKMGFDGFIINNEGNGSRPNGTIVDYNDINNVFQQFNNIVDKSSNDEINNLKLIWYRNKSSVKKNSSTWESTETVTMAQNAREIQLDFYDQIPGDENSFIQKFGKDWRKKLYSFYYLGVKIGSVGNYDFRNFVYHTSDMGNTYDSDPSTSLSLFENYGTGGYATNAANKLLSSSNIETEKDKATAWLVAQEVNNLYNSYQFNGSNGYLSSNDVGTLDQDQKTSAYDILCNDPRIKSEILSTTAEFNNDNKPQYSFSNSDYNEYSYGLGDIFTPYTTITDTKIGNDDNIDNLNETENDPTTVTDFSTGSGINFISRDDDGNMIDNQQYYPWSNQRIEDIQPTYQWDFYDSKKEENNILKNDASNEQKYRSSITTDGQLSGYYDYNDPYKKGNSIAIANAYDIDNDGKLVNGKWGEGPYYWNLMGTNLKSKKYNISFAIKSTTNDSSEEDSSNKKTQMDEISSATKIVVYMSDGSKTELDPTAVKMSDGWWKLSLNLDNDNINVNNNRISKIGLKIDPKNQDNFIYNVGEFKLNKNSSIINDFTNKITSIENKYLVKRKSAKYNINMRIGWSNETKNSSNVDYYEIYEYYDNKWYRLGETTQNIYYMKELKETNNNQIKIGIKTIYKDNTKDDSIYTAIINTKYS